MYITWISLYAYIIMRIYIVSAMYICIYQAYQTEYAEPPGSSACGIYNERLVLFTYQLSGTKHLVPRTLVPSNVTYYRELGIKSQILGPKYLVPSTYPVLCTKYLGPSTFPRGADPAWFSGSQ